MERKLGSYGLADFFAEQRRKRPNFLDAIDGIIKWQRIETLLHKKLGRHQTNAAGAQGGNQDMSRTKGGSTQNCIWPLIRMVCRSGLLLHKVRQQIALKQ